MRPAAPAQPYRQPMQALSAPEVLRRRQLADRRATGQPALRAMLAARRGAAASGLSLDAAKHALNGYRSLLRESKRSEILKSLLRPQISAKTLG